MDSVNNGGLDLSYIMLGQVHAKASEWDKEPVA